MLLCQNAQTFNLEGSLVSNLATRLSCHLPFIPLPLMGFCLFNLDNLGCSTIAESNVPFPSSIRATYLPTSQGVRALPVGLVPSEAEEGIGSSAMLHVVVNHRVGSGTRAWGLRCSFVFCSVSTLYGLGGLFCD